MSKRVKSLKPILNEIKYEPMDDLEIKRFLPHAKIIKYSELSKVQDLDEILPSDKDYLIILVQNRGVSNGHWVVLLRDRNNWIYWDSYGRPIDAHLNDVPVQMLHSFGIKEPYLSNLLKKEVKKGKRVVYNKIAYQGSGEGLATCGRHALFRIFHHLNNKDENEYKKHMDRIKDKYGLTYDQIVSYEIPE